jgi:hypothetical protein
VGDLREDSATVPVYSLSETSQPWDQFIAIDSGLQPLVPATGVTEHVTGNDQPGTPAGEPLVQRD